MGPLCAKMSSEHVCKIIVARIIVPSQRWLANWCRSIIDSVETPKNGYFGFIIVSIGRERLGELELSFAVYRSISTGADAIQ